MTTLYTIDSESVTESEFYRRLKELYGTEPEESVWDTFGDSYQTFKVATLSGRDSAKHMFRISEAR